VTSQRKWLAACLCAIACGLAASQDHPAFSPPSGFAAAGSGDQERTFTQTAPNGDRLRIRVILQPAAADAEAIAKGPALEEGDQIREDTRQDVKTGSLAGVSFSVLGKNETIDGVSYTRYRRAMGLRIDGNPVAFAARADILAKEPRPAQSTLEAMARALTEWQQRLGGVPAAPPADGGGDPASRPAIGGDQVVRLAGGGDLEITVPAFWGRANLSYGNGQEEIVLGPARDVVEKMTPDTIAKDKDRIGPYISITRIQKDTFKDLVDEQLLDIKESLLADYVARMADTGITLTLSEDRDEGTLGARTVISVPFDEKRASGTQHRGRSVFMMHRGSLVIVTASHPIEKFDEGWPDVAKAFDTLIFIAPGQPESAPSAPESRPDEPAPEEPAAPPTVVDTAPRPPRPAPPDWTREVRDALKTVEIPFSTPISVAIPSSWSVAGEVDGTRAVEAVVAAPRAESAQDPLGSALRIESYAAREDLMGSGALARLSGLMRLELDHEGRALGASLSVVSAQEVSLSGRAGFSLQYTLRAGERAASGTMTGTTIDGTALLVDLRIAEADAAAVNPLAGEILGSIRVTVKEELASRAFGPYSVLVPAGWELTETENPGGGRNVFVRSPSGVDVRFQTAIQKRTVDPEVLRRVSTGFLVEALKVLTLKDVAAARRHLAPGGWPGLRFESATPQMNVLVFAYGQAEHLVFALRGSPPGYQGRDLAIALQVMRSFAVSGIDRAPRLDPPALAGASVARRVAYARTELDAVAPDGTIRAPSRFLLALLPDGSAGVVVSRNGKVEDLRGSYRIERDGVTIEGPGLGRLVYRFADDSETLRGEAPGDLLFRARHEESP
jgi:hypothetical protein